MVGLWKLLYAAVVRIRTAPKYVRTCKGALATCRSWRSLSAFA